jgi:hypothetical protein
MVGQIGDCVQICGGKAWVLLAFEVGLVQGVTVWGVSIFGKMKGRKRLRFGLFVFVSLG